MLEIVCRLFHTQTLYTPTMYSTPLQLGDVFAYRKFFCEL